MKFLVLHDPSIENINFRLVSQVFFCDCLQREQNRIHFNLKSL